jgi:hypothetical protein
MELFRIGGPNPDTNYLFMGKEALAPLCPCLLWNPDLTFTLVLTTARTNR